MMFIFRIFFFAVVAAIPATGFTACDDYNPYGNAYFGDLHVHTAYSLDASAVGVLRTPEDALDFGRGRPATLTSGQQVYIDDTADADGDGFGERPLDFMAVTDHSEWFDDAVFCVADETDEYGYYASDYCQDIRDTSGTTEQLQRLSQVVSETPEQSVLCSEDQAGTAGCEAAVQDLWQYKPDPGFERIGGEVWKTSYKAVEDANDPCHFTAFQGYEYSGNTDNANNHRNVIFANSSVVERPLDYIRYPVLGDMLAAFETACTGDCQAVLIPHNPNDSKGQKWLLADSEEARLRKTYEQLVEIVQHKGASECYNRTDGAADADYEEYCGFEISEVIDTEGTDVEPGYIRNGLSKGMNYAAGNGDLSLDYNPFQLGIIGSTDTHNATPGNTREDTWPGHTGINDETPWLRLVTKKLKMGVKDDAPTLTVTTPNWGPGGLAGVWAEENTRESLFAALRRRETFGTSGTRMKVRMFQTWQSGDVCDDAGFPAHLLDTDGLRMGSAFSTAMDEAPNTMPRFVVQAATDPDFGRPLQSIQLIQAVLQDDGSVRYQTIDREASSNSACVIFDLSDFDAERHAYWYARILQEATPRWSKSACQEVARAVNDRFDRDPATHAPSQCACVDSDHDNIWPEDQGEWYSGPSDAPGNKLFKKECTREEDGPGYNNCYCACEQALFVCQEQPDTVDMDIQERAWSSPIWHEPELSGLLVDGFE